MANVDNGQQSAAKADTVQLPGWVVKELLHYAKPALDQECENLGKIGHAGSEQRQIELRAVELAEESLEGVDTTSPEPEF